MNNEQTLLDLGFTPYSLYDLGDIPGYRLQTGKKTFRAYVQHHNGPVYVTIGEVVDHERGLVKRWKDCVSFGSVERFINGQQVII